MTSPTPDADRLRLLESLDKRYSSGLPTLASMARYWRKRLLWRAVVGTSHMVKRVLDILGGLVGLVLSAPVLGLCAVCIKIEDKGPTFFSQTRIGRFGKPFAMYKLRTMYMGAESQQSTLEDANEAGQVIFKMRQDPRVTRVGRILRKYSLDELPQFVNVLKGDMSLVGPRPPLPKEVDLYAPADRERLAVKPGVTCLWQIGGRSELSFSQQVALDKRYIQSQSLALDLKILLKTVPAVLSGRGAY